MGTLLRLRPLRGLATAGLILVAAAGCGSGSGSSTGPTTASAPSATTVSAPGATATTASPTTPTTATSEPTTASTTPTTAPADSTTTSTTTAPAATLADLPPGAPAGLTVEQGALSSGSKGLRTFRLQARLKALKFDPGPLDGAFGLKTEEAIWAYQALRGVAVDGVVNTLLEANILHDSPPSMLRPDLGPTHTEVDLDKQVLLVFRDNALQLVTHVSSGSGRHYCNKGHCGVAVTPTGDYHYQRRISGVRVAPLGVLYNPVYFNGGIAVHGEGSVPRYPASHGCVRIPMFIGDYFPSLVNNGDAISVFRGGVGGPNPAPVAPPAAGSTQPAPDPVLAGA